MKKEIISILISIFLLSAVSVAAGGFADEYGCNEPSTCYQCAYEGCLVHAYQVPCWCHTYCPEKCGGDQQCIQNCLKDCCKPEALEYCQDKWWNARDYESNSLWMRIYGDRIVGCKVQDLLCPILKPEGYCDDSICLSACGSGNPENCNECMSRCNSCSLGPDIWNLSLESGETFRAPVNPGCQNPASFFGNPPCADITSYNDCYSKCLGFNPNNTPEECKAQCLGQTCCNDLRACGNSPSSSCAEPCSGASIAGKTCRTQEVVMLKIGDIEEGDSIIVNGKSYICNTWQDKNKWWGIMIIWYNDTKPLPIEPVSVGDIYYVKGIPSEVAVTLAEETMK